MSESERLPGRETDDANTVAKVLVVDDDQGLSRLIERRLGAHGYQVVRACCPNEALAFLSQETIDLLLLDIQLADTRGEDLIREMADSGRDIPFLVITGQGDERVAVNMMKQGALDYLVKDTDFLDRLPSIVDRAMAQIQQQRKLKVTEEAFRREHAFTSAILETSNALIVVLDRAGRIVRFNSACERLTGYRFDEVSGQTIWDIFLRPNEADQVKGVFDDVLNGHFPNHYENSWVTRNGDHRLIAWSNNALLDTDGNIEYVIGSGIDVTDIRQLEQEVLEISEIEKRRFGHDLHDGLGQHLAGIEFMSQVLHKKLSAQGCSEAESVAEINRLVNEAITQTRNLAKGLSPVVLDENGLMTALSQLGRYTADVYGVSCPFHCESPVRLYDNATATHLYRIAQEAINNALRHGEATEIALTLRQEDGGVELEIEDNGWGFREAPNENRSGGGMGMKIMNYRANMIGGSLTLKPRTQGGTLVNCNVNRVAEELPAKSEDHG